MIIYRIIKKIFDRPLKTCLFPIRQTDPYYCFLESRFFEQRNPFRMLLLRTGSEMKEASYFLIPLDARKGSGRMV